MERKLSERELRSPPLEEVRLSEIPYGPPSTNERGTITIQEAQVPIQINAHEFELYVELTKKTGPAMRSRNYAFVIRNADNGTVTPNILAEATFIERNDHIEVISSIQKENDHHSLTGAGLLAYKKVLELIEDLAKTNKKKLVHTVKMDRSISKRKNPLTAERWLALFGPVLEQHGYVHLDEGRWQKTFNNQ